MRTIAIVNQKGGCGKTTTAINLASIFARRGLRTLLIDMDPQSHCAAGLGVPESRIEYSIAEALLADHERGFDPSRLMWEVSRDLDLAPSTVMLAALEATNGGLHALPDKDRRLESLLRSLGDRYERCLIDCPPTIGLLTYNALRACREAIIPVETGFFAMRGAEKQLATIQRLIAHIGRPIACHLLPTLHKTESALASNILSALQRQFAGQIIPTVIREHEALREAASLGQPVLEYAPGSQANRDFESLADWLEENAANPPVNIEVMATGPLPVSFDPTSRSRTGMNVPPPLAHDPATGGPGVGGRAAELARRMHDHIARSSPVEGAVASASALALREAPAIEADASAGQDIRHVFGVRMTSRGALFLQPVQSRTAVSIAGDFNGWSPIANPMRLNAEMGVFEAVIPLEPGEHQYCLVVDGDWIADPYNLQQQRNSYGESISSVRVP